MKRQSPQHFLTSILGESGKSLKMNDEKLDEEAAFIFKDYPILSEQTNESKNTENSKKSQKKW